MDEILERIMAYAIIAALYEYVYEDQRGWTNRNKVRGKHG